MNTHEKFELPPLPYPQMPGNDYTAKDMHEYALAAIEPYVKRIAELEAARMAYAREFPINEDGEPDVGRIHENIRKLKADRQRNSRPRPNGQYFEGVNIERLRKALTAQGIAAPESLEELAATLARHINALTMQVADRKRRGEPAAWAVFADNGNIRIWCADPIQAETLKQQYGNQLKPLYDAPQPAEPVKALSGDILPLIDEYGRMCMIFGQGYRDEIKNKNIGEAKEKLIKALISNSSSIMPSEDEIMDTFRPPEQQEAAFRYCGIEPVKVPSDGLLNALRAYEQASMDGTMVKVNRQALDEAIALLARYGQKIQPADCKPDLQRGVCGSAAPSGNAGELDERAAFEKALRRRAPNVMLHRVDMAGSSRIGEYCRAEIEACWRLWNDRAALAAQAEVKKDDIGAFFSPENMTGLSQGELIRQLQWALCYWMPHIAGDASPDGERCARDAALLYGMKIPVGLEDENTPTYWEKQQVAAQAQPVVNQSLTTAQPSLTDVRHLWDAATERTGGNGLEAMQHFAHLVLSHYWVQQPVSGADGLPSVRVGHAITKGGRVQSYRFEQTDLPDGEHPLTVAQPQPSGNAEPCFCYRMYPDSNPDASCGDCPTRDYKQYQEKS
jgi:hypothetical protein